MALKLVITTRTEKQFDTLVTLGTHLKARMNWLAWREDGTVILQSAKVKDYFWFPDSLGWFWTWSYFHCMMSTGFEFTRANCVSVLIITLRKGHPTITFIKNNQWEIFALTAKWISTQFWTFTTSTTTTTTTTTSTTTTFKLITLGTWLTRCFPDVSPMWWKGGNCQPYKNRMQEISLKAIEELETRSGC